MQISGLQISGSRISLLTLKKQGDLLQLVSYATQELPEGIIEDGVLRKPKEFTATLSLLKKQTKPKRLASHYVVVGLPEELVYLTVKPFPEIEDDDLREALDLNLREFVPGSPENIFWGYQAVQSNDVASGKEVLLASVDKDKLTAYLSAIAAARLTPVAVEPSSLAAARALKIDSSIIVDVDKRDVLVAAYSGKTVRYSNSLPYEPDNFANSIKKIVNFYKAKKGLDAIDILLSGEIATETLAKLKAATTENVLPAKEKSIIDNDTIHSPVLLGLAVRGLLEQKDDNNLSLLPLGTSEGYEEKKTLHSIGAIANLTTIVCILFVLIFIGFVGLLNYLSYSADQQLAGSANQKVDSRAAEIQKQLTALEPKISYIKTVSQSMYPVGEKLQSILDAASEGITLKSMTMAKDAQLIQVVGVAGNRDSLSAFKESLAQNKKFSKVELVSTNVGADSVDFSLNLTIKK